jgi:hypothetical protein
MKVKLTLIEEMLGTASQNKEVHAEFIASKSKDADKVKEELGALPSEELMEKAVTVFHRDADGKPILFDYQIKGFLKEAIGIMLELSDKEVKVGKTKLSKFTFKRVVDNYVFVSPRIIRIAGDVGPLCTRPLRADTMKGERVSLASSETIPAGSVIECEVSWLSDSLSEIVKAALDYGKLKGLGQWRNSGKGRFAWEVVQG